MDFFRSDPGKHGRDGNPKCNAKPDNISQKNDLREVTPDGCLYQFKKSPEPQPKRQKVKPTALLRQVLHELENQEKSLGHTCSWVDAAAKVIERGKEAHEKEDETRKPLEYSLYYIRDEAKRLEENAAALYDNLNQFYGDFVNVPDWHPWTVTECTINALIDANKDDIEGCEKVKELFSKAKPHFSGQPYDHW